MLYTVQFFALAANKLARQMERSPEKLLEKVQRRLHPELKSNSNAIGPIQSAAEAICRGDVPANAPQPYFDAFCLIVSLAGERIQLGCLRDFRHYSYLEEVGIWPWTQQEAPPFHIPRTKSPPPEFGFLSVKFMREVVLPGLTTLPPSHDGQFARNQFREVVESVVADNLDLISYFTVW